jgi:hypothetical protein
MKNINPLFADLIKSAMNPLAEGIAPDEHSPENIINEISDDESRIASLERQVEYLKKQILRQVNINDGFIKLIEELNKR